MLLKSALNLRIVSVVGEDANVVINLMEAHAEQSLEAMREHGKVLLGFAKRFFGLSSRSGVNREALLEYISVHLCVSSVECFTYLSFFAFDEPQ